MGYNYAEAFEQEKEIKYNQFGQHLEAIVVKVEHLLNELEDVEVAQIIKTLFSYHLMTQHKERIDTKIESISERADALINSPNAQTPEVLAQRKELAEQMNNLLIADEQINNKLKELNTERIENKLIPEEKHNIAIKLFKPVLEDIKNLKNFAS